MHNEQNGKGTVMPALQVRDFPADLYEELKAYAAVNHRSVAQQTIVAVEEMLAQASEVLAGSLSQGRADSAERAAIESAMGGASGTAAHAPLSPREARAERRKRLFEGFGAIPWRGEPPATGDIVDLVAEGRRELSDRFSLADDPFSEEEVPR